MGPISSPIRIPKDMGIVWVPLSIFGGPMSFPESPIELVVSFPGVFLGYSKGVGPYPNKI